MEQEYRAELLFRPHGTTVLIHIQNARDLGRFLSDTCAMKDDSGIQGWKEALADAIKGRSLFLALLVVVLNAALFAQVGKIVIAAGTPEGQALQPITAEPDPQKKLTMYEDFVRKFSSNPAAAAYGNWQIARYYQTVGDASKSLEYGDKALASAPRDLDILVMQVRTAQQMKDNSKVIDYAVRGAEAYKTSTSGADKQASQKSYQFLEGAAFNAIATENDDKKRTAYIKRFAAAFPIDTPELVAYAGKTLAANPDNLPTLLLLANVYTRDSNPESTAKAVTYAQKVIALANADAPDADRSRKLLAGAAHSDLGGAYIRQNKATASIPELKTAVALLNGQDDQAYAVAAYRLGWAYGMLGKDTEEEEVLTGAAKIQGPAQAATQHLLKLVKADLAENEHGKLSGRPIDEVENDWQRAQIPFW